MRLIDADALMDKHRKEERERYGGTFVVGDNRFMQRFMDAPTVDAVPVVRCKDCKWWDNDENSPYGYCMAMKHGYNSANWEIGIYRKYKGDFYCADGEKKEDEVEE